jgi:hypothetical protein
MEDLKKRMRPVDYSSLKDH